MNKHKKWLAMVPIAYFGIGLLDIHLAIVGSICMVLPFYFLVTTKQKGWCQHMCPRSYLLTHFGSMRKKARKLPKWLRNPDFKTWMVYYFGFSLLVMSLTTTRVALGEMNAMEQVRLFFVMPVTDSLPQWVPFVEASSWVTHLAYRMYSMMLSTTLLGLVLGWLYPPRTWCAICPISTLSTQYIKAQKAKS